jgi:putative heme iron utilization protein
VTIAPSVTRSAAEEARTLVQSTKVASLSTLSDDGHPWGSLVTYALLPDGSPILCVSLLAEHGRNVERDPRASLVVAEPDVAGDPLAANRVTLAGVLMRANDRSDVREAYLAAIPEAGIYAEGHDFSFWVLDVRRVRWVGGYGRMDSPDAESYRAAEPDPVAPSATHAVKHLNEDHADALLAMAIALAGHAGAESAICTRADRYGLDLDVVTPGGRASARVGFAQPVTAPDGLRAATVELAKRARQT